MAGCPFCVGAQREYQEGGRKCSLCDASLGRVKQMGMPSAWRPSPTPVKSLPLVLIS